jgi:hypothetical protein
VLILLVIFQVLESWGNLKNTVYLLRLRPGWKWKSHDTPLERNASFQFAYASIQFCPASSGYFFCPVLSTAVLTHQQKHKSKIKNQKQMKKIIFLFALLLKMGISMAQAPNVFNYQGVARDASGNPLANKTINLRFFIREGSSGGPIQFGEQRTVTTNANGLFSTQIGAPGGVPLIGSMLLDWSKLRYLQIDMDANNTNTYTNLGTQQLVSVPYAKFADKAGALSFPSVSTTNLATSALSITNSGTGASVEGSNTNGLGVGVKGSSTLNTGVLGTTGAAGKAGVRGEGNGNGAIGVYGISTMPSGYGLYGAATQSTGTGVYANSSLGTALNAVSASGTGVKTMSSTGLALDVNGIVKYQPKQWSCPHKRCQRKCGMEKQQNCI